MARHSAAVAQPFIEHVQELRQRLFISLAAVLLGACVGYALSDRLLAVLIKPLHQTLFYTTPTGAFSFVIKLSLWFGAVLALPVILYQLIRFLSPLMHKVTVRYISMVLTFSLLLAAAGVASAYFVSLPSALQFLTNFHSGDIKSLITANEYFNFVLAYLGGSALLFQLPLIMMVINRITPLKPGKLMSLERYVIVGSFIIGAVLTPTPDPVNQTLMSVPIIVTYQIGVVLVWLTNRKRRPSAVRPLTSKFELAIPEEAVEAEMPEPTIATQQVPHLQLADSDQSIINPQRPRPVFDIQPPKPAPPTQRRAVAPTYTRRQPLVQSRVISDFIVPS